ncbi:high-affinity choline transporter 1-like [Dermacentor andersoni]|uniref:high-affinity choline transporter 1-like n=1 Tax=Dermacentor andersoni TaxID=34620 RepID=UPI003B3B7505
MAVSILGALIIILYYIAVVSVGVWAGRKSPSTAPSLSHRKARESIKPSDNDYLVRLFLANRSVPLVLGVVSMTGTWVGGAFLNTTAEAVFTNGIVWCQAPFGYALSLMVGGWFFAGKMRVTKALTMLDPFQQHYGKWISILLTVPAVFSEVFWSASVLTALGNTVETIVHLNSHLIIIASALVILFYTALGGLYSVIYTDLFQMFSTVIGLWTCLPYVVMNKAAGKIGPPENDWIGTIEAKDTSQVIDSLFMNIFGGIPWQAYFQRVLSTDSIFGAKMLSYLSAMCCLFVAVPSIVVGAVAKTTNFTALGYGGAHNLSKELSKDILPQAIHYMAPSVVGIVGQLAITASVMSSMDSSILSASSLITRNVYHFIIRPTASDTEISLVLRGMIWLVGVIATATAISARSVVGLWSLSSDMLYVLLFPQFVALFYLRKRSNAYGAVLGFVVGGISRALCGEPLLQLPALIQLPSYDAERGQQFPFRTLCMLLSLVSLLLGSAIAKALFRAGVLLDVCRSFVEPDKQQREESSSAPAAAAPATDAVPDPASIASPRLTVLSPSSDVLSGPTTSGATTTAPEEVAKQKQSPAAQQTAVTSATGECHASSSVIANHANHRKGKGQKSKKKRK